MRLNLLFMVMELLTVLAYPVVFVHGKLLQLSNPKQDTPRAILFVKGSIAPGR